MRGVVEYFPHVSELDDPARVHNGNVIAHSGHDTEVVRDEEQGQVELLLEIPEQREVLGLNRRVQCGRCFVSNEELWLARNRGRADHALAHAAAELMRVVFHPDFRGRHPDLLKALDDLVRLRLAAEELVQVDGLTDLVLHVENGIEARQRILENNGDTTASDCLHLLLRFGEEVFTVEANVPAYDFRGRLGNKPQQRKYGHGLAAPGLTDQAKTLACVELEADTINSPIGAATGVDVRLQVFYFEQCQIPPPNDISLASDA